MTKKVPLFDPHIIPASTTPLLRPGRLTAGTYKFHPFRKEHDLPNLHDYVPCENLQGCTPYVTRAFVPGISTLLVP